MSKSIFDKLEDLIDKSWKASPNLSLFSKLDKELREKLPKKLLGLYELREDAHDKYQDDETGYYFAEGVKIGLQIGFECAKN